MRMGVAVDTQQPAAATSETAPAERGKILAALMVVTGLAALDATIVATAVPSIVGDLGGFAHFPWVFSIYLLTQAVTTPIYGKLADLFGRKPVLFFGIGVFLLGSVLCGSAWSMVALIAFRGLQGVGAGAIVPMTQTIAGDLYTPAERGRALGLISSVWGVSAVLGPTLGGLLSQYATWRWIFFINLPIGGAAIFLLQAHLRESVERRSHRIDYAGAAVLTTGLSLLILGLLEGGIAWPWLSPQSIALFVAAAVLLSSFWLLERRAVEPILPTWLFGRRILIAANVSSVAFGAVLIGQASYIPTFAQGVLGVSPVLAGLALCGYTVGWSLSSTLSPRVYLRTSYRTTALLGGLVMVAGCLLLVMLVDEHSPLWHVAIATFVTGIGMGLVSTAVIVGIQSVVGWSRRGMVTSANMFMRALGSAVGVAVFGAIANTALAHRFHHPPAALRGRLPTAVDTARLSFDHSRRSPDVLAYIQSALSAATHWVFVAIACAAVLMFAALLLYPRHADELVFPD